MVGYLRGFPGKSISQLPQEEEQKRDSIVPARAVRRLRPYDPVSSLDKIKCMEPGCEPLKLDWNESTVPPAPGVKEAICSYMANGPNLHWYPPLAAQPLLKRLSDYSGVPASHILVTSGSDDALNLVCTTYLDNDDPVVVPYPTYTHLLVFAGSRGAKINPVTYGNPFRGEPKTLLGAMGGRTRMVYLVNPNNPTGVLYRPEQVRRILQARPNCIVVVDEAYYEFEKVSCAQLLDEHPNLVILRTFSKAFGLAGMRVGYILAQPARIKDMMRVHNPKSVNVLGLVGAAAALDDVAYTERNVQEVNSAKELACRSLENWGLKALSTPANWILVQVPCPSAAVEALEQERVFVRDRSIFPQLHGFIRISIGNMDQTRQLMERLERAFSGQGWLRKCAASTP